MEYQRSNEYVEDVFSTRDHDRDNSRGSYRGHRGNRGRGGSRGRGRIQDGRFDSRNDSKSHFEDYKSNSHPNENNKFVFNPNAASQRHAKGIPTTVILRPTVY